MRAVIQRITQCSVTIDGSCVGTIGSGLLILLGVAKTDTVEDADYLAEKIVHLRIFGDNAGKMNRSLLETGGGAMVVSQFTLFGDSRKGRRPSFIAAAGAEQAKTLYEYFTRQVQQHGIEVATGRFGAMMEVELVNDGPVTLIVDSRNP